MLEVADHGLGAVGAHVVGVVGVADEAADAVSARGQEPRQPPCHLAVRACDGDVHAAEASAGFSRVATDRIGGSRMDVLLRNNVRVFGPADPPDPRPLVFAHGFGCDQNMWRLVTPAFEDRHRIVLFDHVGAGASDLSAYDPTRYAALDGYADDVLEILRALDLRDVVFVGHSVSAMIGVLAANAEPERFGGLVLVGPSPRYIDDDGYVGGFSREDIDELLDLAARATTWAGRPRWRR